MNNNKVKPVVFDRKGDELQLDAAYFLADPADTSEPLPEALTFGMDEPTTRVYLHGRFLGIILEKPNGGGDFYALDPQNQADETLYKIDSRENISGQEWRSIYETYLRRVIPGLGKAVELTPAMKTD